MIKVDNLSRCFGSLKAVNEVSFTVSAGEIFGFLGPNGAGKTTTINMLCTLLRPTSGRAEVNGYDIVGQRADVRRSIGVVFQESSLDEYLTAEQNLRFHAYAYSIPAAESEKRMKMLLDLVGLTERRKSRVNTFSGGMKRRLEIARGLLHEPRLLFLDEPTLGLDLQTRRHIWDHILDLRCKNNLTIFLTTHYMDEAENCQRISIIDNGCIIAIDTPERLKDSVGGDQVTLQAEDNTAAAEELKRRFGVKPHLDNGTITFTVPEGEKFIAGLLNGFDCRLVSINIRRPTLDDVFLKMTGRAIREEEASFKDQLKSMSRRRGHGR